MIKIIAIIEATRPTRVRDQPWRCWTFSTFYLGTPRS